MAVSSPRLPSWIDGKEEREGKEKEKVKERERENRKHGWKSCAPTFSDFLSAPHLGCPALS